MTPDDLLALCARARDLHPDLDEPVVELGEVSMECPAERLPDVVRWLKDEGPFEMLADFSAIDWYRNEPPERRFLLSAQLASISHPQRLRLRVWLPEDDPRCPSLVPVWPGANFLEREMWDMFGIVFDGHPKLARIHLPDDWEGHPQRKDEPLGGIDVRYQHGQAVTSPDLRGNRATSASGYPAGRTQ